MTDAWDREGEAAQSLRIVLSSLELGESPPDWAVADVVAALKRYDEAEVGSIGEAFGFPWNKHLAARRAELNMAKIALAVQRIQEEGKKNGKSIPLRSNSSSLGALELAGNKFNMSAETVRKYRALWIKRCRDLGRNQNSEPQKYADPGPILAKVVAEALRPLDFSNNKSQKK